MQTLSQCAFNRESLERAWKTVLANDLADGELSSAGRRFEADYQTKLDDLATELFNHIWEAGTLTPIEIPKNDGMRQLHIPTIADRIVARAILDAVNAAVDPLLGAGSFAFRPGLGVNEAVREVAMWRQFGFSCVARTDVKDCFPTLPREIAVDRLFDILQADEWFERVVIMLTHRRIGHKGRVAPGVPQGCPLSPMLANLVLTDVDEALQNAGFPVIRYADDIAIMAESVEEGKEALDVTRKQVEGLGMELNTEKRP